MTKKENIFVVLVFILLDNLLVSSFASFKFTSRKLTGRSIQIHRQQSNNRRIHHLYCSSNPFNNINLNNFDINHFHQAQWNLLIKHHVGNFIGIQTGYDPTNSDVADYMYTTSNLSFESTSSPSQNTSPPINNSNNNEQTIIHSQSIVAAEIRSDCEVCFDSERLKTRTVGKYNLGKLKSRFCENVEIRGPGITPRGLSTEIIIRDEKSNSRMKVLLAYEPAYLPSSTSVNSLNSGNNNGKNNDDDDDDDDTPKLGLRLFDFVIVRERINQRPLNTDVNPDTMWIPKWIRGRSNNNNNNNQQQQFMGVSGMEKEICTVEGTRHSFLNGLEHSEVISPTAFSSLSVKATKNKTKNNSDRNSNNKHHTSSNMLLNSNNNDDNDEDSEDEEAVDENVFSLFRRVVAGGVLIETPHWIRFDDDDDDNDSNDENNSNSSGGSIAHTRVTWTPLSRTTSPTTDTTNSSGNNNSQQPILFNDITSAEIMFTCPNMMKQQQSPVPIVPELLTFFVDKLTSSSRSVKQQQ